MHFVTLHHLVRWMLASPAYRSSKRARAGAGVHGTTYRRHLLRPAANPTSTPVGSLQLVERYKTGLRTWDEHRRNRWAAIGVGGETAQVMDEEYRTYHTNVSTSVRERSRFSSG